MNIQEQIDIVGSLRSTIIRLVEYLHDTWYNTEEDMLDCTFEVVGRYSGCWSLSAFYRHNEHYLTSHWDYSEPWEDNDDSSTFDIPIDWLQWYVDGELDKINKEFLEACEDNYKEQEDNQLNDHKWHLERLVDELGKEAVLELVNGVENVNEQ